MYRIRKIETDKGTAFRIDLTVTKAGHCITLPGLYESRDSAQRVINYEKKRGRN